MIKQKSTHQSACFFNFTLTIHSLCYNSLLVLFKRITPIMANFRTHLTVATTASIALAASGFYVHFFGLTTAVVCAIIGTIGGLLPDIDLDHSTPTKLGFLCASLIIATLIVIFYANAYDDSNLILDALVVWAVSFLIIRFGVLELFSRLTVHRGMVHSVPYMAMFGLLVVHGAFYGLQMTAFTSWVLGLFLFLGSLVHLTLDEIYSVNILGLKVKKSFGTALKLFELDKPLQYGVLYAIIVLLFFKAPPYQEAAKTIIKLIQ